MAISTCRTKAERPGVNATPEPGLQVHLPPPVFTVQPGKPAMWALPSLAKPPLPSILLEQPLRTSARMMGTG